MECNICNDWIHDFGHNAEPVVENGRCCDLCNYTFVIPSRLGFPLQEKIDLEK